MVFCFQNCSDLLGEKNILVIKEKFDTEGRELLRPELKQFTYYIRAIQTQSGKNDQDSEKFENKLFPESHFFFNSKLYSQSTQGDLTPIFPTFSIPKLSSEKASEPNRTWFRI